MLRVTELLNAQPEYDDVLTLPYDKRQKSRLRTQLKSGREVALLLPRGTVLRGGDCLRGEDGAVISVESQAEPISRLDSEDAWLLMRVAYHLGNRHVPLEIIPGSLRYLKDHVLDQMVEHLGLSVQHELAPFEPEQGAYGGGHHH